jgi:hypothetical protein
MTEAARAPRRLAGIGEVGPYETVYVSASDWAAPLSCAGRMIADRRREQRGLVVAVFDGAEAQPVGADLLTLGYPGASYRTRSGAPALEGDDRDREAMVLDLSHRLEEVFRLARPRTLLIPLGVGGRTDALIAHEAALGTFHAGSGRDVYLYEDRPEAFVSGSVRIRLARMGARLPPAASRIRGEGSLLRLLIRTQTVPRLDDPKMGLGRRSRAGRGALREWLAARSWRPLRALGPRLQPLLARADAGALDEIRDIVGLACGSGRGRTAERILAFGADQARRLGASGWAERFWLLLPEREDVVPARRVEGERVS